MDGTRTKNVIHKLKVYAASAVYNEIHFHFVCHIGAGLSRDGCTRRALHLILFGTLKKITICEIRLVSATLHILYYSGAQQNRTCGSKYGSRAREKNILQVPAERIFFYVC